MIRLCICAVRLATWPVRTRVSTATVILAAALGLLLGGTQWAAGQTPATAASQPAYQNLDLSFDERAADLVSRMTLLEKAAQVQMDAPAITRLGIPAFCWRSEGLHGLMFSTPGTVFPQAIAFAATWDPPLIRNVAGAIADEARAQYIPGQPFYSVSLWAPVVNMLRDPRWGRAQESYGEDPYLTGRIGVAYCQGLQGDDPKYLKAIATPKHFAVHSQETLRTLGSATVTERTLRDYYLPAFHACFADGGAAATMSALSALNKVPCTINPWLHTDLLRNEWKFSGAVVTDLGWMSSLQEQRELSEKPEAAAAAVLQAGVDVICESGGTTRAVQHAVQQKLLPEEVLDRAVRRNLRLRLRLGLMDPPEKVPYARTPRSVTGCPEHVALALQSARESAVLLQNNAAPAGYGFEKLLPLDLRKVNTLAVLGPYASLAQFGGYSAKTSKNHAVTPVEGLQAACGDRVKVLTADWEDDDESAKVARQADVVVLVVGLTERMEGEGFDRKVIDLPLKQTKFVRKMREANPLIVLVLEGGGPIALNALREQAPAILLLWYPGE